MLLNPLHFPFFSNSIGPCGSKTLQPMKYKSIFVAHLLAPKTPLKWGKLCTKSCAAYFSKFSFTWWFFNNEAAVSVAHSKILAITMKNIQLWTWIVSLGFKYSFLETFFYNFILSKLQPTHVPFTSNVLVLIPNYSVVPMIISPGRLLSNASVNRSWRKGDALIGT